MAYLSSAAGAAETTDIEAILAVSRRRNTACGVTGMLCHYDGSFLQFLEGLASDVDATFARIYADPRHRNVVPLYRSETSARLFADWSMAIAAPDAVSAEQRAFCKGLRGLEVGATREHMSLIAPFLDSFMAWMR